VKKFPNLAAAFLGWNECTNKQINVFVNSQSTAHSFAKIAEIDDYLR